MTTREHQVAQEFKNVLKISRKIVRHELSQTIKSAANNVEIITTDKLVLP